MQQNKIIAAVNSSLKLRKGGSNNSLCSVSFNCTADFFTCGNCLSLFLLPRFLLRMSQCRRKHGSYLYSKVGENLYFPLRFCFSPNRTQSVISKKVAFCLCTTRASTFLPFFVDILCLKPCTFCDVSLLWLVSSLHFFHSISENQTCL